MIEIQQIWEQKKQYLPLLLLGDEQESMIDRYLEQGTLYVMQKAGNPIAVCVILRVSETEWEVKNLAVAVSEQVKGETFRPNERIKVYIVEVKDTTKGPQAPLPEPHHRPVSYL